MQGSNVRVLVVDDYARWRNFICSILRRESALQVVGEVSDGPEAVEKAQELQPDLILLDIELPTLNGIEAARRIRERAPQSKILFVSQNRDRDVAEAALGTGAGGYLVKSDAGSELFPAVVAVLQGKRFVSASVCRDDSATFDPEVLGGGRRIDGNPYLLFGRSAWISELLATTIDATAADFGNVQLFDSTNRVLRIVAQRGFGNEFLTYFDTVSYAADSACSKAMIARSRIVVADVATDPVFSNESRAILLRANTLSVQSTPLIGPFGEFLGMVSTHYRRPAGPTTQSWKQVDDLIASFLEKNEQCRRLGAGSRHSFSMDD